MCINRSSYGISVLTSYDVQGEKDGLRMDASYTCDTYLSVRHMIYICIIYIVIYRIMNHLLRWDAHGWLSELILFGPFWCQTSMFPQKAG